MFLKSLQVLGLLALVTLGAIVAYATLRLRAPADTLAEAEGHYRRGDYLKAVLLLETTERSAAIAGDPELEDRLLRLRYAANTALGNPTAALVDVATLLQRGHRDDEELLLDQIRLLASDGDGERARAAARAFLADRPDHSRGLELAGEACQTVYQPRLRALRESIERELARPDRGTARDALLAYVYRPDLDPEVPAAAATLADLFSVEPRLAAAWPPLWREAQRLRDLIQEGLGFFQRSIDNGGQPVAAFRAVATALEQAGRTEDLLMACEIQRRSFEHSYVDESGAITAWIHLRDGMPGAAVAAARRWLWPRERLEARAAADALTLATEDLVLAWVYGAWLQRDAQQLDAANTAVQVLRRAGRGANLPLHVGIAARAMLRDQKNLEQLENSLRLVATMTLGAPPPLGRPDLAAEFVPHLLDVLARRNASEADQLEVLARWRQARSDHVEPHLATARYHANLGRTEAALAAIEAAAAIDAEHPEVFPLRLSVARRHYEGTDQDGPGLLAQCAVRRALVPEVLDPIGFVLCAETALQQPDGLALRVAAAAARSAVDAFPRANLPRRLEIEALLAAGRNAEAAGCADRALLAVTPDPETLALAIRAKQAAGESVLAMVRRALPQPVVDPSLQAELVRLVLATSPADAERFVTPELSAATAARGHRLLVSRALSAAGRVARAAELLDAAGPDGDGEAGSDLAIAFADWLRAAARRSPDEELRAAALARHARLGLGSGSQAPLLAVAEQFAETHATTARSLLRAALAVARADERTGRHFALAGELALRARDWTAAADHWTAALAFADGRRVAEDLCRLLIARNDLARAGLVYQFVDTPTEAMLAARFGRFDLNPGLIAAALLRDPSDLLVHAALATFGQTSLVDWTAASGETLQLRLELLACLAEPLLAPLLSPRAEELARREPDKQTSYLLLARVASDAGLAPAASRLHAELRAAGLDTTVFFREVAYAAQRPGYQCAPELQQRIIQAVGAGDTGGSQRTLTFGLLAMAEGFASGGHPEAAERTRLSLWLAAPQALPWTTEDLDRIAAGHTARDACFVFEQILLGPNAGDADQVLARFYAAAPRALADAPESRGFLLAAARRHVRDYGARGDAVHFLLGLTERPTDPGTTALLEAHLDRVASGADGTNRLDATLEALTSRIGLPALLQRLEAALDRYPTAIPIWAARARLATRGRDHRALDDLRHVVEHVRAPEAELEFLGLAAGARVLGAADLERLERLPARLRATPEAKFVSGMVELRQGRADAATKLLGEAAPKPDGMHLFVAARAWLESDDEQGGATARALLERMRRDYDKSSLARYCGSFVRQLSPREASADDNDTNR